MERWPSGMRRCCWRTLWYDHWIVMHGVGFIYGVIVDEGTSFVPSSCTLDWRRWEISRGVKVTLMSVAPLVFAPSAAPAFGVFLRLVRAERDHELRMRESRWNLRRLRRTTESDLKEEAFVWSGASHWHILANGSESYGRPSAFGPPQMNVDSGERIEGKCLSSQSGDRGQSKRDVQPSYRQTSDSFNLGPKSHNLTAAVLRPTSKICKNDKLCLWTRLVAVLEVIRHSSHNLTCNKLYIVESNWDYAFDFILPSCTVWHTTNLHDRYYGTIYFTIVVWKCL